MKMINYEKKINYLNKTMKKFYQILKKELMNFYLLKMNIQNYKMNKKN